MMSSTSTQFPPLEHLLPAQHGFPTKPQVTGPSLGPSGWLSMAPLPPRSAGARATSPPHRVPAHERPVTSRPAVDGPERAEVEGARGIRERLGPVRNEEQTQLATRGVPGGGDPVAAGEISQAATT